MATKAQPDVAPTLSGYVIAPTFEAVDTAPIIRAAHFDPGPTGGLGVSVHEAYRMNRHVSNQWLVGIVTALASGGVRVVRVFAVFGFLHSLRVATRYAEAYAKELTTKWGSMVLDA